MIITESSGNRKDVNLVIGIILVLFILSINLPIVSAQNEEVVLHFFYGKGCPHCGSSLEFLNKLEENYPSLIVEEHEVYFNQEERKLFEQITNAFGTEIEGVPTIFINDKVFVGFSNSIAESIENEIDTCLNKECDNPINKIKNEGTMQKLTLPAVILAAIVDAINPCAFAVLIILMSTILISKEKKKALFAGLAFSASIFISYFLMGIGLYSAIQATGLSHTFFIVVAVLAIFLGLFNLKDYLWYGKWFVMEVPLSWRPKLQSLIKGITSVPGAFAVGFLVSLFLLPCTSGPYIIILGLLAQAATKSYALFLLIIYNLIFILPMVLITFAISFGFTTTEKAEKLRKRKLKILHLIAGIIILCLGIGMLIAVWLGMI
ncbi:MAG: cytochrome c biogenesis protein [Nanoarchaeota archaeon]|nr:cytochrome c biogenesis protein [Nanoarchaeota archaeon]